MTSDRAKFSTHLHFVDVKYSSLVLLSLLGTVTFAAKSVIKEMCWFLALYVPSVCFCCQNTAFFCVGHV